MDDMDMQDIGSGIKSKIKTDMLKNATVFLNPAVRAINQGLNQYENLILAIVNLQIALELAIKAKVVEKCGIQIIVKNITNSENEKQLEEKYESNSITIRKFEEIKNYLKAHKIFPFEKVQYSYLERFQTYRNRLVHFNYHFSDQELSEIERDILYVFVFLLGEVMGESLRGDSPTYMQEYLDVAENKTLMKNPLYRDVLQDFIQLIYGKTYLCPICSERTFISRKKCLGCLIDLQDDIGPFGYIDCTCFGAEETVIYDRLNLDLNAGKAQVVSRVMRKNRIGLQ